MEDRSNIERKILLIIDDDVEWTDLLQIFFANKYDVHIAHSAIDAIEFIKDTRPSAMILDLVMPSVDGFGLMQRLSTMSNAEIPTVLTTGWVTADVASLAASIGCAAVLGKPVSLSELDGIVSGLMDGTYKNQPKSDEPEILQ